MKKNSQPKLALTITHSGKNHCRKNQRGVTLVELMIAITISSIVMIGIGSVYTSSKRSFKLQEEFSRLQENGRFAINHITRFVRSAGYAGCASATKNNMTSNLNNPDDHPWSFDTGLEGYEFVGTEPNKPKTLAEDPTAYSDSSTNRDKWKALVTLAPQISLPASANLLGTTGPIPNTDILVARTADGTGVEVAANNGSGQVFITDAEPTYCPGDSAGNPTGYSGICTGDVLVISDCQKAIIFQATNVQSTGKGDNLTNVVHAASGSPGNASSILPFDLKEGDEVMKISTKVFFIGEGTNGPALFMKQGSATSVELVEGVETMQVLYGEDTDSPADNIPNRYVPANQVTDFADIVAVRVDILLRSVKELPWRDDTTKTFLLGGSTTDTALTITSPNDKRLRKVMSTTIKLRNRAFTN